MSTYLYPKSESLDRGIPTLRELASDALAKSQTNLNKDTTLKQTIPNELFDYAVMRQTRVVELHVHNFNNRSWKNCTVEASVDEPIMNVQDKIRQKMRDLGIMYSPFAIYVPDLDYKNNPVLNDMVLKANPSKTLCDYGIVPGDASTIYAEWRTG